MGRRRTGLFNTSTALIAVAAVASNALLAAPAEANLWKERRAARAQLARLPGSVAPVEFNGKGLGPRLRGDDGESRAYPVPSHLGTVRSTAQALRILHIQDLHLNGEAQANIGAAVSALIENGQADLIALEGAFGPIDVAAARSFPLSGVKKATADFLLREHHISGAVHAAITADAPAAVVGVDDKALYDQNVAAYKAAAPLSGEAEAAARAAGAALEARKSIFNPALRAFDRAASAHRRGDLALGAYVKELRNILPALDRHAAAFARALDLEASIDFSRVEREREALIAALAHRLKDADLKRLFDQAVAFRAGDVSPGAFFAMVATLSARHQVPLDAFPHFVRYVAYVRAADAVDAGALLSEISRLEDAAYEKLALTDAERRLAAASRLNGLRAKLARFSLTAADWAAYKSLKARAAHDRSFDAFERFYRLAEARDRAIADNLRRAIDERNAKRAVVIAGGFHAEGLRARLGKDGWATFVPTISRLEANGTAYLSAFTRRASPLEALFDGQKIFLAPSPDRGVRYFQTIGALGAEAADPNERLDPAELASLQAGAPVRLTGTRDTEAGAAGTVGDAEVSLAVAADGTYRSVGVEPAGGKFARAPASFTFVFLNSQFMRPTMEQVFGSYAQPAINLIGLLSVIGEGFVLIWAVSLPSRTLLGALYIMGHYILERNSADREITKGGALTSTVSSWLMFTLYMLIHAAGLAHPWLPAVITFHLLFDFFRIYQPDLLRMRGRWPASWTGRRGLVIAPAAANRIRVGDDLTEYKFDIAPLRRTHTIRGPELRLSAMSGSFERVLYHLPGYLEFLAFDERVKVFVEGGGEPSMLPMNVQNIAAVPAAVAHRMETLANTPARAISLRFPSNALDPADEKTALNGRPVRDVVHVQGDPLHRAWGSIVRHFITGPDGDFYQLEYWQIERYSGVTVDAERAGDHRPREVFVVAQGEHLVADDGDGIRRLARGDAIYPPTRGQVTFINNGSRPAVLFHFTPASSTHAPKPRDGNVRSNSPRARPGGPASLAYLFLNSRLARPALARLFGARAQAVINAVGFALVPVEAVLIALVIGDGTSWTFPLAFVAFVFAHRRLERLSADPRLSSEAPYWSGSMAMTVFTFYAVAAMAGGGLFSFLAVLAVHLFIDFIRIFTPSELGLRRNGAPRRSPKETLSLRAAHIVTIALGGLVLWTFILNTVRGPAQPGPAPLIEKHAPPEPPPAIEAPKPAPEDDEPKPERLRERRGPRFEGPTMVARADDGGTAALAAAGVFAAAVGGSSSGDDPISPEELAARVAPVVLARLSSQGAPRRAALEEALARLVASAPADLDLESAIALSPAAAANLRSDGFERDFRAALERLLSVAADEIGAIAPRDKISAIYGAVADAGGAVSMQALTAETPESTVNVVVLDPSKNLMENILLIDKALVGQAASRRAGRLVKTKVVAPTALLARQIAQLVPDAPIEHRPDAFVAGPAGTRLSLAALETLFDDTVTRMAIFNPGLALDDAGLPADARVREAALFIIDSLGQVSPVSAGGIDLILSIQRVVLKQA